MKAQLLVGGGGTTGCYGGSCPTVYRTDRNTYVVQGNLIPQDDMKQFAVPSHEGVVEIPESLIRELVNALQTK
jgi:hypothetical protein